MARYTTKHAVKPTGKHSGNPDELLSAARAGDQEKCLAILARPDFGPALNWTDKVGRTALHLAADNKLEEVWQPPQPTPF